MTLDEAIKHAEEVADLCEYSASRYDMNDPFESHMACKDGKCAEEHRQIAEWLKELKRLREPIDVPATNVGDLISRQAAIDVVEKWFSKIQLNGDICCDGIRSLPSAEPEKCGDCISRTELLKKQQIIIDEYGLEHKIVHIGKIIDAPSVEPERKTGKWIPQYDYFGYVTRWRCSECDEINYRSKFCPDCGANMEENHEID